MNSKNNAERYKLYHKVMPWYDACPIDDESGLPIIDRVTPYGLYNIHQVKPEFIQAIQQASIKVGNLILEALPLLRSLKQEDLLSLGFPAETLQVIKHDKQPPFCLRLDWCWTDTTQAVLEINAQTPSFLVECHAANQVVAEHFNTVYPTLYAEVNLELALTHTLQVAAHKLGKPLEECHIAFTALNNVEDMGTMKYLRSFCTYPSELFPLEYLRVTPSRLFNVWREAPIDILFNWYPLEWLIEDQADDGTKVWSFLEQLILSNKVVLPNLASGFLLQPKSTFAFIQQAGYALFNEGLEYLPKTAFTPEGIGTTYFSKPILGRQGEGISYIKEDKLVLTSGNSEWYRQQECIYQEALTLPQVKVDQEIMTGLYGAWLFFDGTIYLPGGVGLRVSDSKITNDTSYYLPIGF